jgi:hypothetical protein
MSAVGETQFPEICNDCREMFRWKGPSKRRVKVCGCTPEPAPKSQYRTISTAKKGRNGERKAVKMLTGSGLLARQTAGSGAVASRNADRANDTDIVARLGGLNLRIEVKALETVPGLKSLLKLKARSDVLCVETGDGIFWLMDDDIARHVLALAAEGLEP